MVPPGRYQRPIDKISCVSKTDVDPASIAGRDDAGGRDVALVHLVLVVVMGETISDTGV
jgi:hypothetical protein